MRLLQSDRRVAVVAAALVSAAMLIATGCGRADPQLTIWIKSGQVVAGTMVRSDASTIVLRDGAGMLHEIPRERIAVIATSGAPATAATPAAAAPPVTPPADAGRRTITAPAGSAWPAALRTALASATAQPGMRVEAVLGSPLVVDGEEVAPAGATVAGTVTGVRRGGAAGVPAHLILQFDQVQGGGGPLAIETRRIQRQGRLVRRGNRVVGALGSIVGRRQTEVGADFSLPAGTRLEVVLAAPLTIELRSATRR
jgi:hypothetical protein